LRRGRDPVRVEFHLRADRGRHLLPHDGERQDQVRHQADGGEVPSARGRLGVRRHGRELLRRVRPRRDVQRPADHHDHHRHGPDDRDDQHERHHEHDPSRGLR